MNPRPTHYECVALPLSYCGFRALGGEPYQAIVPLTSPGKPRGRWAAEEISFGNVATPPAACLDRAATCRGAASGLKRGAAGTSRALVAGPGSTRPGSGIRSPTAMRRPTRSRRHRITTPSQHRVQRLPRVGMPLPFRTPRRSAPGVEGTGAGIGSTICIKASGSAQCPQWGVRPHDGEGCRSRVVIGA